ncbi:MAG: hypothetical protein JSV00_09455 [bacterium]|nr:MAG: hypothetical protein JSV00_09455 [bacterium]
MNRMLLAAAAVAAMTTVGHFLAGTRLYLLPMTESDFDPVARKVMHAVFHYISVFLVTSTVFLLLSAFGLLGQEGGRVLARFIAVNYALFAVVQMGLALRSGMDRALVRMFQWVFFLLIAMLAGLGA